jgi:hypothetical protein
MKWTPSLIDGNEKLNREIEKIERGTTLRVDPVASCHWTGRIHWLTYLRKEKDTDAVFAWIEEPGAPLFELYREERSKNAPPFYLPVRQWVPFTRLELTFVPSDVQLLPFVDWRVNPPSYPVTLRKDAVIESGLEEIWNRLQGKRLQAEGHPRLHHHDQQLYRLRVAMWEGDRYCGLAAVPLEWLVKE